MIVLGAALVDERRWAIGSPTKFTLNVVYCQHRDDWVNFVDPSSGIAGIGGAARSGEKSGLNC